ncbi:expressed unknown protein [Seminavis robusta]|uniref:Uncharacterized protein n=1 Tax=Seminavis robusta TaxID=568900 RepID=A0A9N8E5G4_9STRA|nr:expressed unknown protein [Seminavis robusta]|eukprot:Sro561_g166830.1 n/a (213) ;mRNA; f:39961-40599
MMKFLLRLLCLSHTVVAFSGSNQLAPKSAVPRVQGPFMYSGTFGSSSQLSKTNPRSTRLYNDLDNSANNDTFQVATIMTTAAAALASSLGVFWSEASVFQTGCGPLYLPDWLERSFYLGVLAVSGISVFFRIVFPDQGGLTGLLLPNDDQNEKNLGPLRVAIQASEAMALLAVFAAVIVLVNQSLNGEAMDGLSGIDLDKCRARQTFELTIL